MTIGEKIRSARIEKNLTQSDIAEDKITRNMLSAIESGRALPSLDTLLHIADKLDLPASYLLSDEEDASVYKKSKCISSVRAALSEGRYDDCITLIQSIGVMDDELAYVHALASFQLGAFMAKRGFFMRAEKYLREAEEYAKKTVYDTKSIECRIPLYMSFVKNVNAPLLDFDIDAFRDAVADAVDFEFFKYVCNDTEYDYSNEWFKKHVAAKIKIKERKYYDAIALLLEIAESKSLFEYNAYLMYGVYSDLDKCYKQITDFENAYKYSEKRISMLEGFNS